MAALVLSVWVAQDTPPDGGDPIRLTRVDGSVVASHGVAVDDGPCVCNGKSVELASALTKSGLSDERFLACVGDELWRRVAPGAVGTALGAEIQQALIYLDLRSPALLKLPWELLRYSGAFVFARDQVRFCLGRPQRREGIFAEPPAVEHPIRMMVVIGNKSDSNNIRAEEELERIEQRAHAKNADFLLKVLFRPAPTDIERTLTSFRPHILHFVGHGSVDATGEPVIEVWSQAAGQNEPWSATKIVNVISTCPPRLAVLNACQSAATTQAVSLIDAFSRAGVPAVIGMMGDILGDASVHFSLVFYRELCAGSTVDQACTKARGSLQNLADGGNVAAVRSNWPLPRLIVHGDASQALRVPQPEQDLRRWAEEDFVDRWEQRWDAWRTITQTSRLTVLYGNKESGKTALLRTIAEAWARIDRRVIFVDVSLPPRGGWLDLLSRISKAAKSAEGVDHQVLEAAQGAGTTSDEVIPKYRTALEQCAGDEPLLVAIDGLSDWQQDLIQLPEFCAPYLRSDPHSRVHMLVALREAPDTSGWGGVPSGWRPIEVGLFSQQEWKRAVKLMGAFWRARIQAANIDYFDQSVLPTWLANPRQNAAALSLMRRLADGLK